MVWVSLGGTMTRTLLLALALGGCFTGAEPNPPVSAEPAWDSPRTRELAQRACFDCHSNETVWPWYSRLPIVSGRIAEHVQEGRSELNFSEWDRPQEEAHESAEVVDEGEMPPANYVWLHPEADLTHAERAELIAGLQRTLGGELQDDRRDHDDDD
jgi:mono/diheme cytochrome c family protein